MTKKATRERRYRALASLARDNLRTLWAFVPQPVPHWYALEGYKLERIARASPFDRERVTTAAAILSPATRWEGLLDRLPAWLDAVARDDEGPRMPGYGANVRKARWALRTDWVPNPRTAPKVARFRLNLLGDPEPVTLDRHAIRAALGPKAPEGQSIPFGLYCALERAYQTVAREVGVAPCVLQSGVWGLVRENPKSLDTLAG